MGIGIHEYLLYVSGLMQKDGATFQAISCQPPRQFLGRRRGERLDTLPPVGQAQRLARHVGAIFPGRVLTDKAHHLPPVFDFVPGVGVGWHGAAGWRKENPRRTEAPGA
jgi:hypothetical protein